MHISLVETHNKICINLPAKIHYSSNAVVHVHTFLPLCIFHRHLIKQQVSNKFSKCFHVIGTSVLTVLSKMKNSSITILPGVLGIPSTQPLQRAMHFKNFLPKFFQWGISPEVTSSFRRSHDMIPSHSLPYRFSSSRHTGLKVGMQAWNFALIWLGESGSNAESTHFGLKENSIRVETPPFPSCVTTSVKMEVTKLLVCHGCKMR